MIHLIVILASWVLYFLTWKIGPISIAMALIFSLAWLFRKKISETVDTFIANKAANAPQSRLARWYFTPESIKKSASGADQPERKVSDKTRNSVHNITCTCLLVLGYLPVILKGLVLGFSALWRSLVESVTLMAQDLLGANGFWWIIFSFGMWILSLVVVVILLHIAIQAVWSAMQRHYWSGFFPKLLPWTSWLFDQGSTKLVAAITYVLHRFIACFYFERSFGVFVIELVVVFIAIRLLWRLARNLLPAVLDKVKNLYAKISNNP